MRQPTAIDIFWLCLLAAIWGSSFFTIKIAVETVPPVSVAAGRVGLGALLVLIVVLVKGRDLPRSRPVWGRMAVVGILNSALPFFLIAWGETRISSGLAAVLMAVGPIAALTCSHFISADDRITGPKIIGFGLGFSGVAVLIGGDALAGFGGALVGELAVLGGAVSYAVSAVLSRGLDRLDPVINSAGTLLCSAAVIVPLALIIDRPWTVAPSPASLGALIYLGVLPTAGAAFILFHLIRTVGASFVSQVNYIIPVIGMAAGVVVLGEALSARMLFALLMILAGIAISRLRPPGSVNPGG